MEYTLSGHRTGSKLMIINENSDLVAQAERQSDGSWIIKNYPEKKEIARSRFKKDIITEYEKYLAK